MFDREYLGNLSAAHPERILAPLASEPTLEVSAASQPFPSMSSNNPSSDPPLIGTSSSSVAPTPQSLPASVTHLPLDVRSPTTHSPVSPASSSSTAPGVTSPMANNPSVGGVGDSLPNPSWSESPTQSEASPEMLTMPSTPSKSRTRDRSTPMEMPSKRPPVQFGSAPHRVLTTAPPKRKGSQRHVGRNSRQPARTNLPAV